MGRVRTKYLYGVADNEQKKRAMNMATTTSILSLSFTLHNYTNVSTLAKYPTNTPLVFLGPSRLGRTSLCSWKCRKDDNFKILSCFKNKGPLQIVSTDTIYQDDEFVVVNFYSFVYIKDPQLEVSKHLSFLQGRDVHGRIYLNEQGINAQYSGPYKDAVAYVTWLKDDDRFSDILVQISHSFSGHAFPRLKLRYKPSLVQLEGGISHLPLLDLSKRAKPLTPSQWRSKLETVNKDYQGNVNLNTTCILLDVRNGYEWDIGHFRGAERPDVDCFRSTSYGQSESGDIDSDPLARVDKENTDILMYCTGGIRCDVYSAILRQRGFKNLYTLKGGISHYLGSEGPVDWVGNLFVFDARLSLPPSSYKAEVKPEEFIKPEVSKSNSFAKCHVCSTQLSALRHRNCANLDCNLLFLCCAGCTTDLKGCCCLECTSAPRLRPVLIGQQRYKKWHHYRDMEMQNSRLLT